MIILGGLRKAHGCFLRIPLELKIPPTAPEGGTLRGAQREGVSGGASGSEASPAQKGGKTSLPRKRPRLYSEEAGPLLARMGWDEGAELVEGTELVGGAGHGNEEEEGGNSGGFHVGHLSEPPLPYGKEPFLWVLARMK